MRNQAKLFKTDLANTQFVCNFQPRKPLNIVGANGGFKSDESPNSLDLSLEGGVDNIISVGHAPGSYAAYLDGGSTRFTRAATDAALIILGDCTVEAILKLEDVVWPSITNIAGVNVWDVKIRTTGGGNRSPSWGHGAAFSSYTWTDVRLPANEWIYLAFVRDDTAKTVTLYIDGTAHSFVFSYPTSASGAGTRLGVGSDTTFNTNNFIGWMSGIRVRDIAATAAQIAATADRVVADRGIATGVPALLPEILPSAHSNVRSWIEAGSHDLDDGDSVQTPTTLAGAGTDFTQATLGSRPLIYQAAGQVGWKMFDGTNTRYLTGTSGSNYIQLSPVRYHVFLPFELHNAEQNAGSLWQNHRLCGDDAGWWGVYARRTGGASSGDFEVYGYHYDSSPKTTHHKVSRSVPHLLEMWYDSGTGETVSRLDAGPEVRVVAGNLGVAGPMEIGGNPGDDFQGVLFGALFANDVDPATRVGIRNYYSNKYGMDV